eukprot:NODE_560_length_1294_cov_550.994378_g404_i0.p1 GENE.NODE_560_length_1294_cov_550.994378_g404_i0~~NODE_560_length_1294_cov_550.994378_g404_i0.p1  ORF type:complete len:359 (+),score=105.55 NODE_560_length_1294_cov_550.994378_g404_i0:92-1168(+)
MRAWIGWAAFLALVVVLTYRAVLPTRGSEPVSPADALTGLISAPDGAFRSTGVDPVAIAVAAEAPGAAVTKALVASKPTAVIVTLYNETPRARMRFFDCLQTWENYLRFAHHAYPVIIFYLKGVKNELTNAQQQELRELAPSLNLEFLPVTHTVPAQFQGQIKQILEHQQPKRGLGYIFCSQFLGFEMYKHPRLQTVDYILRLDDDITFDHPAEVDLFVDMAARNKTVGWNCIMRQWEKSSAQMDDRILAYVARRRSEGHVVQPLLDESMPQGRWDMRLFAGCVEIYKADLFRQPAYFDFLEAIDMLDGIYKHSWMEQAFKTLWMEIAVPKAEWQRYACELPTLHRGLREQWFDYEGC